MNRNQWLACSVAIGAVVLLALPACSGESAPKATVTSVRGTVLVLAHGEGPPTHARSGTALSPGARLEARPDSRATILLPWGAFKILRSGDSYVVPSEAPSESGPGLIPLSKNVANVFLASREKSGRMEKLDIRAGTRSAEGGPARLILLSPRNTTIAIHRPTFVWSSYPDAKKYKITIIGSEGRILEASSTTPSFTYGADTPSLKPGATYFWEVAVKTSTAQVPSEKAHFTILGQEERGEVRTLVNRIRSTSLTDQEDSSSHYLLANIFIRKGLYEMAARSLLTAARMNPDDQGLIDLLQGVYREMQLDSQGIALFQELL